MQSGQFVAQMLGPLYLAFGIGGFGIGGFVNKAHYIFV